MHSDNFFSWIVIRSVRATLFSRINDHTQTYNTRKGTKHSQHKDFHDPGGIRTRDPSKREDEDPRLRRRGHRNWVLVMIMMMMMILFLFNTVNYVFLLFVYVLSMYS